MSDRSKWDVPRAVEINGQPITYRGVAQAIVYLAALCLLCGAIVLWRRVH